MSRITRRTNFAIVPEWVVAHAALSDRAVRLYALLARYADAEGGSYHSRRKMATTLHCSPSSLDRAATELAAVGAVTIEARFRPDGSRGSNNYIVESEPALSSPMGTPLLTDDEGGLFSPDEGVSSPVVTQEREPGNETKGNEKEISESGADDFEIFWQAVPHSRRVGKGDARKAWATAIRSTHPETIILGMERYAEETAGRDPKFLKTPGPWIRSERWLDEPGANRDQRTTHGARQSIASHDGPAGRVTEL